MPEPSFTLTAGPTGAWPSVQCGHGRADGLRLRPGRSWSASARTERKVAQLFLHIGRHGPDAGRGRARARGGRAGARAPGYDRAQPRVRRLRQVVGLWLAEFGAELIEIEVPYDEAVDPAAVAGVLADHPETSAPGRGALGDAVGHAEPPREIGPIARAHGALTLADVVSSLGGERARRGRLGARPLRGRAAEVPGGAAGDVAGLGQRAGLGGDPREPGGPARILPVAARLEGAAGSRAAGPVPYTPSVVDVTGVEAACDELLGRGSTRRSRRHRPRGPRAAGRRPGDGARALAPQRGVRRLAA